ncbi:MAG: NifU family protein [Acidobacteria bacterium]|nr:NifU family protein [Acidobacteriota bacterium]
MSETEATESAVRAALDEVRPALQMDGGDVEFVALEGQTVKVKLLGACGGCPMATMTLVGFVEERVKAKVPAIARVESV